MTRGGVFTALFLFFSGVAHLAVFGFVFASSVLLYQLETAAQNVPFTFLAVVYGMSLWAANRVYDALSAHLRPVTAHALPLEDFPASGKNLAAGDAHSR